LLLDNLKKRYKFSSKYDNTTKGEIMYSPDIKELNGQIIGKWTVVEQEPERAGNNEVRWLCRCDCGAIRVVCGGKLRQGNSKSCGCTSPKNDITGQKHGNWTVIKRMRDHEGNSKWLCEHTQSGYLLLLEKSEIKKNILIDKVGRWRWIPIGLSGEVVESGDGKWVLANGYEPGEYVIAKCESTGIVAIFKKDDFSTDMGIVQFEKKEPKTTLEDLTGNVYGSWRVIEREGRNDHGQATWKCECTKCGKIKTSAGFAIKRAPGCRNCVKIFGDQNDEESDVVKAK